MYNFQPLFSVDCHHGYYYRGITPDLVFVPSAECQGLMKNYGLFFRPERTGFQVLYKSQGERKHLMEEGKEGLKFSFYVKNRNYLFGNFSDLPMREVGKVFHFQNREAKGKGESLTLHREATVSAADEVNLVMPVFQYPLDQKRMPGKVSLRDENGAEVAGILNAERALVADYELPAADINLLTLNLREEGSGRYALLFDGKTEYEFYTADINPMDCFGVLDIHFGGAEARGYELKQKDSFVPRNYLLRFEPRSTTWKYYFIAGNGEKDFEPVKILELVNGKKTEEIPFSQPKEVQMNTGDKAYLLVSQSPLQLAQLPRKLLLEFNRNGESGLKMDLPNPDVSQVKPDPGGKNGILCSEIFVYV